MHDRRHLVEHCVEGMPLFGQYLQPGFGCGLWASIEITYVLASAEDWNYGPIGALGLRAVSKGAESVEQTQWLQGGCQELETFIASFIRLLRRGSDLRTRASFDAKMSVALARFS